MRYLEIVLICELGAPLVHTRPAQLFLRHAILPYCHAVHWRTPYRCVLDNSQTDAGEEQHFSERLCVQSVQQDSVWMSSNCQFVTDSMMKLGQANLTHL